MSESKWGLYTVILAENERDERLNLACVIYGPDGYCRAAIGKTGVKRACEAFGWKNMDAAITDSVNHYVANVFTEGSTFEERKAFVDQRIDRGYPGSIIKYRTPYGTMIRDDGLNRLSDHYLGVGKWEEWHPGDIDTT